MRYPLTVSFLLLIGQICPGQTDSTRIFERSKGSWPLPIAKYIQIYDNEQRKHFTSNQFDSMLRIITDSSYDVKAVHEGTVVGVFEIRGEYTVLSKFGNYFVAYSPLAKPNLSKGEYIKAGQHLGKLTKDSSEDEYMLEIYLSNGKKELSAKKWIAW